MGLLAACGGSSSGASADASSTGSSKSPIVIGNVSTLTGPAARNHGSVKPSLEAWVSSLNAAGGINGHPVKLIIKDDGGSASVGVSDVEGMIKNDHIVALVGESDTNVELTWEKYVDTKKIPVIGGFASGLEWASDPYFFPSSTTGQAYTVLTTAVGKKAGGTTFGFAYCVESVTCKQVAPIIEAGAKAQGMKWGGEVAVSASAPSYAAPCLLLKKAGVNAIENSTADIKRFADSCAAQGFTPTQILVGPQLAAPGILTDAAFNNRTFAPEASFPWFIHNSQTAAFQAAMAKYAPGVTPDANSTLEWTAGKLFEAAAKGGSGPVTPKSLTANLRAMKAETLGGLAPGPLDLTNPSFHPVNCSFIVKIANGAIVAPQGLKTDCVQSSSYTSVQPNKP
jgi:branched-chain amino acid transport system substrate-binding protein